MFLRLVIFFIDSLPTKIWFPSLKLNCLRRFYVIVCIISPLAWVVHPEMVKGKCRWLSPYFARGRLDQHIDLLSLITRLHNIGIDWHWLHIVSALVAHGPRQTRHLVRTFGPWRTHNLAPRRYLVTALRVLANCRPYVCQWPVRLLIQIALRDFHRWVVPLSRVSGQVFATDFLLPQKVLLVYQSPSLRHYIAINF